MTKEDYLKILHEEWEIQPEDDQNLVDGYQKQLIEVISQIPIIN